MRDFWFVFRIVLFLTFRAIDSNQQQKIESFFLPGKGTPKYSTKITSYSIIWDCDVYVYSCFPLVRARKKGFTAQPPPTFLKYLSFIFSTLAMLCFVLFRYRQFSQLFIWRPAWVLATHRGEKKSSQQ